jgi:hypothetical protein
MVNKSKELMNACIDKANDRLNIVNGLMLGASEKCDRVTELLRRHDVPPDTIVCW